MLLDIACFHVPQDAGDSILYDAKSLDGLSELKGILVTQGAMACRVLALEIYGKSKPLSYLAIVH